MSILRHHKILQLIPRSPLKVTTSEIIERLATHYQLQVSVRQVQRDMVALESIYAIETDTARKPYTYSLTKQISIPALKSAEPEEFLPDQLATHQ